MLPRLDGFFTIFIMSIIMLGTPKSSVENVIRWIDRPCLVPFLPGLAQPDREAFRASGWSKPPHNPRCRHSHHPLRGRK